MKKVQSVFNKRRMCVSVPVRRCLQTVFCLFATFFSFLISHFSFLETGNQTLAHVRFKTGPERRLFQICTSKRYTS